MKHWLSPLLVLALLFGASLGNARSVSRSVEEWCGGLELSLTAAENGDWDGARRSLEAVYDAWSARQTYFHIMVEHAELDAAEALFAVSRSDAHEEDRTAFRADIAELFTQLALLREMEALSVKNIL